MVKSCLLVCFILQESVNTFRQLCVNKIVMNQNHIQTNEVYIFTFRPFLSFKAWNPKTVRLSTNYLSGLETVAESTLLHSRSLALLILMLYTANREGKKINGYYVFLCGGRLNGPRWGLEVSILYINTFFLIHLFRCVLFRGWGWGGGVHFSILDGILK